MNVLYTWVNDGCRIAEYAKEVQSLTAELHAARAALAIREEHIDHLFRHSGREGAEDYDALEVSAAWARLRQPVLLVNDWLSTRDARMKREGAAEWLESKLAMLSEGETFHMYSGWIKQEAKRLREGK